MKYKNIVARYERRLAEHGDSHLGVDWPTKTGADTRYGVMLDVVQHGTILDFGCGCSGLLDYMEENNVRHPYSGTDISESFLAVARSKYPNVQYYLGDVLQGLELPPHDYVIMNGVLTVKEDMTFDEMWSYSKQLLRKVFTFCDSAVAVNFMSKAVDWERNDLFHLPVGMLVDFVTQSLSRKYTIRHDYGLYEYTIYIHKSR